MPDKIFGVQVASWDVANNRSYITVIAANTSYTLHTLSAGKRGILRKLNWMNRAVAGNGFLRIGYTNLAAAFVQVFPDILMVQFIDGGLTEDELPIIGNSPLGFMANTTLLTGSVGNIIVQCSVGGAAPNDVMVSAEIEEIG